MTSNLILVEKKHINSADLDFLKSNELLEILFRYKEKICNSFEDIKGTFLVDHMSINIIDANNRLIIFSTTPSIEHNLATKNLLQFDKTYFKKTFFKKNFISWEDSYDPNHLELLKKMKQTDHGLLFGFNIAKTINDHTIVYSFATRSNDIDHLSYYCVHMKELFSLGDYVYRSMENIYNNIKTNADTSALPYFKKINRLRQFQLITNPSGI